MNNSDFNNVKLELEKEIKKNNELIEVNHKKMGLSKANQFGSKMLNMLLCAVGLYGVVILAGSLVGAQVLLHYFKISTVQIASITIPVIIGTVGTLISNKIQHLKKDYKEFSKAKKESDKIEEEVKYAIEIEKAKNNNKVLLESLASLKNNHGIMRVIENKYNLSENDLHDKRELESNYEGLTCKINVNNRELDELSTKKVLIDYFSSIRENNINFLVKAVIGGMIFMLATLIPGMIIKTTIPEINQNFFVPFAALFAGGALTGGYALKKENIKANIFKKINDELGSNALPEISENPEFEKQAVESRIYENIKETASMSSILDELADTLSHIHAENENKSKMPDEVVDEFIENLIDDYSKESYETDVKKLTLKK